MKTYVKERKLLICVIYSFTDRQFESQGEEDEGRRGAKKRRAKDWEGRLRRGERRREETWRRW